MRLIKVLGLAAVAALAAMALVGVSSASAEPDEITICLQLIPAPGAGNHEILCPKVPKQLAPADTKLLLLAKEAKLVTSSGTVVCEDSVVTALTLEEVGNPLKVTQFVEFGKLPTPKLGEGCNVCTGGIHTAEAGYPGEIKFKGVDPKTGWDEFFVLTSGTAVLLNCFGFLTCEYGTAAGTYLDFPIDRDATLHEGLKNAKGDLVLVNKGLVRTGGSGLCPATGTWNASYTGIGCHLPGVKEPVDCWIALDNKV